MAGLPIKKCKALRTAGRVTVVRGLTVLRGLRAINQESLVALSTEILTAS